MAVAFAAEDGKSDAGAADEDESSVAALPSSAAAAAGMVAPPASAASGSMNIVGDADLDGCFEFAAEPGLEGDFPVPVTAEAARPRRLEKEGMALVFDAAAVVLPAPAGATAAVALDKNDPKKSPLDFASNCCFEESSPC